MISLIVYENDSEQTLLNFLKKTFKKASLAKIYYLFYEKKIKINQKTVTNFKYQIKENDIIVIYDNMLTIPEKKRTIISDPGAKLLVHYEDDNIIIVNKPHNIMIHSVNLLSLDNMVRYYLQIQAQAQKINLSTFTISHLYRLDKLTLGLVVYPKNRKSQQVLLQAQNLKKIIKYYYAVVSGVYDADNWQVINGFIKKDEQKQKMIFTKKQVAGSKNCVTMIKSIYTNQKHSLICCKLVTGRKHQIRATLSFLNYPIIGDKKYGSKELLAKKIMLFAYKIKFTEIAEPLAYLKNKTFSLLDLKEALIHML